jgi:hypothetical protein
MPDLAVLALAAGFAGFVDAIVGGGGLILVPALFAAYPRRGATCSAPTRAAPSGDGLRDGGSHAA